MNFNAYCLDLMHISDYLHEATNNSLVYIAWTDINSFMNVTSVHNSL